MTLTPYAEGFYQGIRYQRDHILDFVSAHLDAGVLVTVEDIVADINQNYKKDMDNKVKAMTGTSFDTLLLQLDHLTKTITDIEKQASEIANDIGGKR